MRAWRRIWKRPPEHDEPEVTSEQIMPSGLKPITGPPLTIDPVSMPWDTGIRNGQGEAGDYVAFLRQSREAAKITVESKPVQGQLVKAFGGQQGFPDCITIEHKEDPVQINFTVEVSDLMQGFKIAEAIREAGGKTLSANIVSEVTETHENSPIEERVQFTHPNDVAAYLDRVADTGTPVLVRYKSSGAVSSRLRDVTVARRADHTHSTGWCVYDQVAREARTFILTNIESVEGPAR